MIFILCIILYTLNYGTYDKKYSLKSDPIDETCPDKEKEFIDLKDKPTDPSNVVLYGCKLENPERINGANCRLLIYFTTFKNLKELNNIDGGGAIYVKKSGTLKKEGNTSIDHCTFENCESTNGGAISLYSRQVKVSRAFIITNCKFTGNIATNKGGSICIQCGFCTISKCEFLNNKCSEPKGNDIYYENIEQPNTQEDVENPFLIQNCQFKLNDNSITGSLIYLNWNKHSDFIFESNEILLPNNNNNYLFESSGTISSSETLECKSNCISPSKTKLCITTNTILYNRIESGFTEGCSSINPTITITPNPITPTEQPSDETCPDKEKEFIDLKDKPTDPSNVVLYGCKLENPERINGANCRLLIYFTTFKNLKELNNIDGGGAIYVKKSGTLKKEGNTSIDHCTFENCESTNGGAISLYSKQVKVSRAFIITNCKFTGNIATNKGGSICIQCGFCTISKCEFLNNKCSEPKGNDIYYENIEQPNTQEDVENPFLIQNCQFKLNDNSITGSLIYLNWNKHSDFIFESNEILLPNNNNNYLFESSGTISSSETLECKSNCISPSKTKLCITTNTILYNRIESGFTEGCSSINPTITITPNPITPTEQPSDETCPDKEKEFIDLKDKPTDPSNVVLYGCKLENPERINGANCRLLIYFTTFKNLKELNNIDGGGAIYVKKSGTLKKEGNTSIDHCIFENCESTNGGAISLYSRQVKVSRAFIITNCKFTGNIATNKGGSICIQCGFCTISKCEFLNNKCSEPKGNDIYYENIEQPNTQEDVENPFLIQNCQFKLNDNSITGSLIYLNWNKHSDFIFESNEILLPNNNNNYLFESSGTISSSETLECKSNCISPSKTKLCITTNTILYNRIESGFTEGCSSINPTITITPNPITPTEQPSDETCPDKEKEFIDLKDKPTDPSNVVLYGCKLENPERINGANCRLLIYFTTFKNLKELNNIDGGGAIYVKKSGTLKKEGNTSIDHCIFENCESTNGGAISLYSRQVKVSRAFIITNCKFTGNIATNKGGSICIQCGFCTISKCEFLNNKCSEPKGNDIYYENIEQPNTQEDVENPFLIQNCQFKLNDNSITGSLIYLNWNKHSDFIFESNEILLPNNNNNYLFESSGTISSSETLECKSNCISPSKTKLCITTNTILYNRIESGFTEGCSSINPTITITPNPITPTEQPSDETCPDKEKEFIDLKDKPTDPSNVVLYGCKLENPERINGANCRLLIYFTTFKNLKELNNIDGGGAIYVKKSGTLKKEGNTSIDHCTFENCESTNGGAISLYSKQVKVSRAFIITNCKFTGNIATNKGGSICIQCGFCTISKCEFLNNKCSEPKGNDIYYENIEQPNTQEDVENPFLIQNCQFKLNDNSITGSLIYLNWNKHSDFIFESNEILLPNNNNNYLFESSGTISSSETLECKSNCISPSKTKLCITTNTILYNRIESGFTEGCSSINPTITITPNPITPTEQPSDETCPDKEKEFIDLKDKPTDPSNVVLYGCKLENPERINGANCRLLIYFTTFKNLKELNNIDGGGAIYVKKSGTLKKEGNTSIDHCTFENCESTNGGAISLYSKQVKVSRAFIITNCKFTGNIATNKGGSICIQCGFCTISKCEFLNNKCSEPKGNDIYYENIEQPNTQEDVENPFLIQNCQFKLNDNSITGSLIYLNWNKHSDFIFESNEILLPNNNNNYLFESSGTISSSETLECKSNCISPSKTKLCITTNTILYNRIESGFTEGCSSINPTITITPNPITPTEPTVTPIPKPSNEFLIDSTQICTSQKHCENQNTNEDVTLHVKISYSLFEDFHYTKDGGAIRLINCGLSGENTQFKKCYSEKGGGGGIFIVNEKIDSLPITLSNIKFTSCSAEYGGAIYIYSISDFSPVLINSCQFNRNTATSTNERNQFYGGSAIYLTIKNGDVNNCLFSNNKGKSQIKVNRNYDAKPSLQSTRKHSISISKCTFEIDQNSQSSLFVVHNNKNDVVNVLNCVFVGNLTNDSYHIDGKSLSNEKPNIRINSCKFSSDSKKAINSRFMKIDSKNQIFKFDPNNSKLSLKFWISAATFLVAAVAFAAAFIVKRHQTEKIDQSLESHEILTKSIEDTHDI